MNDAEIMDVDKGVEDLPQQTPAIFDANGTTFDDFAESEVVDELHLCSRGWEY